MRMARIWGKPSGKDYLVIELELEELGGGVLERRENDEGEGNGLEMGCLIKGVVDRMLWD